MASAAEARIRDKAERLLRGLAPDGRIIHEFELTGVRLDLAAVTPDRLILAEIKSELDTLDRLPRQLRFARSLGGPVLVCVAERWREALSSVEGIWACERLVETADGFDGLRPAWFARRRDTYDSRRLMDLMLKAELYALAAPLGARSRHTVLELQALAHEHLTGRQIRQAALAALRARRFGWTCDAPVEAAA